MEGNFSYVVRLDPPSEVRLVITKFVEYVVDKSLLRELGLPMNRECDLVPSDSWHISLSKPFSVKSHMVDSVLSETVSAVRISLPRGSGVFLATNLTLYSDESGKRIFAGVPVDTEVSDRLLLVIHQLNRVFRKYALPEYYKDASPHVSLFWWEPDSPVAPCSILGSLAVDLDAVGVDLADWCITVSEAVVQVGDKIHIVSLS